MARLPFPENTITGHYGTISEYRKARGMQPHSGTDFAPAGSNKGKTVIPAVGNGTIKLVRWSNVLGWNVVQTIWDIKKRKAAYVGYSHLKCNKHGINCKGGHDASEAISLKPGDKISEGDAIGVVGNTGSASSGCHLHLTIGWTERAIYGVTSDKFNYIEWLKTQTPKTKQTNKKTEAMVLPKVKTCPICGQEIK